tara:strand:- start:8048 stop:9427 length:1380 start_codon:yes stop_codon:yes gene_type:complete
MGLFGAYPPNVGLNPYAMPGPTSGDRQQALYQGLMAMGPMLMAAGAPSLRPGGNPQMLAQAGGALNNAMRGYLNDVRGQNYRKYMMDRQGKADARAEEQFGHQRKLWPAQLSEASHKAGMMPYQAYSAKMAARQAHQEAARRQMFNKAFGLPTTPLPALPGSAAMSAPPAPTVAAPAVDAAPPAPGAAAPAVMASTANILSGMTAGEIKYIKSQSDPYAAWVKLQADKRKRSLDYATKVREAQIPKAGDEYIYNPKSKSRDTLSQKGITSRHDYWGEQVKKPVQEILAARESGEKIFSGLGQKNGIADIAVMNSYQRLIDDAVVRGEDIRLINSAQSLRQQWAAARNRMVDGDVFTEGMRQKIGYMTNKLMESATANPMARIVDIKDRASANTQLSWDRVMSKGLWDRISSPIAQGSFRFDPAFDPALANKSPAPQLKALPGFEWVEKSPGQYEMIRKK